ncbi:HAD family hydrolase [Cryobacterium sp. SO2]|uniref:HAD family hydrolase n=1 Tax=Cryobacterium sp. SO2 TaxID=1897060 RepID=UPI00223DD718|nr:HAD family hydrolase [Cryobacterium sp. SO2]WEO76333.1 HAD family hydrolase [Cryobacterium sp. SO2]
MRHLFLDFFGTLVNYADSRAGQGYADTHASMLALGARGTEQETATAWLDAFHQLNAESDTDHREFTMEELSRRAIVRLVGREPDAAEIAHGATSNMADWERGVVLIPGMAETLKELGQTFTLTIVSNTHSASVVPRQLAAMGATDLIANIVTSLEVGFRKPHSAIYQAALDRAEADPARVIFVGDTWDADFDGPRAHGMEAVLVAAAPRDGVPETRRVSSVLDLPDLLSFRYPSTRPVSTRPRGVA